MALDLGTLAAKLKLDDSDLQRGLRAAPAKAAVAGKQIGDNAERGARPGLAKLGGLFAGLGIAKMAGDLLGFGLKTAMGMEKAKIGFTTMLGSGKRAETFLKGLKDFAATTPFEFPELQGAASKLLAAGINANKVIPIMTTLGNVTSGMGTGAQGIDRAVVALQQMNAAGKITGEDLNQLRDAGIPVYDLLAAATGRTKKEVAELAQKGKLGGKDLAAMMKALETGKGLEKFNGLMGAQSKSLEGIISTLKDTVGQGLADALTPMIPSIKEGIGAFTEALPGILGGIRQFGTWVVKNQGWLSALAKGLGVVAGAFIILNAIMAVNPISLVVLAIAGMVAALIWCYDNVTWFRNGVDTAFAAIGAVAKWLWNNAFAPVIRFIVTGFGNLLDGWAGVLDALGNIPGFEWAKEAAGTLRDMAEGARDVAEGIKDITDAPEPKLTLKDEASKKVDVVNAKIKGLKDKMVTARAKGDTKEVDRLKTAIDKLRDKRVNIIAKASMDPTGDTITYKVGASGTMRFSARARGGPVRRGMPYLVGELGPELVTFGQDGNVHNNRDTQQMLSGSGSTAGSFTQIDIRVAVAPGGEMAAGRAIEDVLTKYKAGSLKTSLAFERTA